MTPEVEARIKQQTWERMRQRLGDDYLADHADFLEAQWEWAKELGMIDEETDLTSDGWR
jgi:hypothetical protein